MQTCGLPVFARLPACPPARLPACHRCAACTCEPTRVDATGRVARLSTLATHEIRVSSHPRCELHVTLLNGSIARPHGQLQPTAAAGKFKLVRLFILGGRRSARIGPAPPPVANEPSSPTTALRSCRRPGTAHGAPNPAGCSRRGRGGGGRGGAWTRAPRATANWGLPPIGMVHAQHDVQVEGGKVEWPEASAGGRPPAAAETARNAAIALLRSSREARHDKVGQQAAEMLRPPTFLSAA